MSWSTRYEPRPTATVFSVPSGASLVIRTSETAIEPPTRSIRPVIRRSFVAGRRKVVWRSVVASTNCSGFSACRRSTSPAMSMRVLRIPAWTVPPMPGVSSLSAIFEE